MRFSQQADRIIKNDPIANNAPKTYRAELPMDGQAWDTLRLNIANAVVIGTGAGPITLGGYKILKGINIRTSRNESPISIPAAGLYWLNLFFNGNEPYHVPIAAADGIYNAIIDIPFSFKFQSYKDDLLLQTNRYSYVELELLLGGLADLFTAPGTATLATKADIILSRSKNPYLKEQVDKAEKKQAAIYIHKLAAFNPVNQPYADVEIANDLALFGFLAMAYTGATAGVSFSGTPADILDDITWRDNLLTFVKAAPLSHFQAERKKYGANPSGVALTGMYPHLFSQDGSIMSGFPCGPVGLKTEIRFEIGSIIGAPNAPQVDLILFGMRTLR